MGTLLGIFYLRKYFYFTNTCTTGSQGSFVSVAFRITHCVSGHGSSMSEERSTETVSKNAFAFNCAALTSADLRDDIFSLEGFVAD